MPMDAQQLIAVFNEIADSPEELKKILNQTNVKEDVRAKLKLFQIKAGNRISAIQGQVDAIVTLYQNAITAAEGGSDVVTPTIADEDNALL